jgi:hypothetical protein
MFVFNKEEISFTVKGHGFRFRWIDAEDGRTWQLWFAWVNRNR